MSLFITVEGLDCAGKTSIIIPYLQNKLDKEQNVFLADMKTGNISKGIRKIFMDPESVTEKTDWTTIALLASVARSDMVHQEIKPALENNKNVFCDRYVDTSFVYNKESHTPVVASILDASTQGVVPNAVIFAYCSYSEMVRRKGLRDDNDQWDLTSEEEYNQKLKRYKDRLYTSKTNCNTVVYELDSTNGLESVYQRLDEILKEIGLIEEQ